MSDGSGPVNMAPLTAGVDAQNVPDVVPHLHQEALIILGSTSQAGGKTTYPEFRDNRRQLILIMPISCNSAEARPLTEAERKQIEAVTSNNC